MTVPTGTLAASGSGVSHETEDLSDVIARIDPSETPVFSGLSKGTATSINHEWTVQELKAVDGTNFQDEGDDPDYATLTVPDRYTNKTQISTRAGIVSGTFDSVGTVGGSDRESTRQKVLKGLELRRDLELIITQPQVRSTSGTRKMGSIPSWITNQSSIGASTTPTGDGSDVSDGAGTDAAWVTIDKLDEALLPAYTNGGKPKVGYCSPYLKQQFSKLPDAIVGGGAAYVTRADNSTGSQFTFIGAADVYQSDWGPIEIAPSIHMAGNTVQLIDPNYMKFCTLPGRSFMAKDVAPTGDAKRFYVLCEGTLEATAPKAHAHCIDMVDP